MFAMTGGRVAHLIRARGVVLECVLGIRFSVHSPEHAAHVAQSEQIFGGPAGRGKPRQGRARGLRGARYGRMGGLGGLTERAGHHVVDLVECALPVEGHPPRRVPEPISKQLGQGRWRHRILFIKKRHSDACLVGKGATVTPLPSAVPVL